MANPGVAAQVVQVQLVVITDLFLIMAMRVSSKYNQIVSCWSNRAIKLDILKREKRLQRILEHIYKMF
jgi:hypothetical protein